MKTTTKKLMWLNYNYYKEMEQKLERYAKEGLILEETKGMLWTFKKTEPQNLRYTVTYFKEASVFNPHPTENQLTYFEYAQASGWDFVCEYGQMQIFSSELENPPPFETDESEMLINIHKCMKKSFIPSQIVMLVAWMFNLFLRIDSLVQRPSDFLADNLDVVTLLMFCAVTLFTAYSLLNYYHWYYKSKKSIGMGGDILNTYSKKKKYLETTYVILLLLLVGYLFLELLKDTNYGIIALSLMQVPLFIVVFYGSIKLLKKFNISANANRIVSWLLLLVTFMLYLCVIFSFISNFDFMERTDKPYATVEWEVFPGETREYYLYQDNLPLTCEDLYGEIGFLEYSYEEDVQESIFLKKEMYSQTAVPMENPPPELDYTIYTPKFNFVYDMIVDELTTPEEWSSKEMETLDNSIFGTKRAYIYYYLVDGKISHSGEYLLVFENQIISIHAGEPLTGGEIQVVKEKLHLE